MNLPSRDVSARRHDRNTLRRRAGRLFTLFATLSLIAVGCANSGEKNDEAAADDEVTYKIGEPVSDSTIAAIVTSEYGTDTLTAAAFRQQVQMVETQFPQIQGDADQRRELRRSIVEDFVLRHAVFGEADRLGLTADTARVEGQIRQYRQQAGSEEAFQQILAANQMTEDSLRSSIGEFVRQQMVLEQMAEGAAAPTEAEIEAYRQDRAQQVRASHILFLTQQADESAEDSIRQQAEAVLDSIRSGADFAELARRHSQDPGSAAAGGDLGFFSRGQMVAPFEEATFALEDSGDVATDLVETQFGFHIIKLTGRRAGTPMDTTRARAAMMQQRRQDVVEAGIDTLRGKVTVRLNQTIVDADLNKRLDNL